jgi:glyoxylase-like metal-dependent hydrolase (beta-lactamase superfamily II)
MTKRKIYAIGSVLLAINAAILAQGCVVSGHPAADARWGESVRASQLEARLDQPGPIEVESVASATWQVPLEGMLNLDHPAAKAARLETSEQPVVIYFHALRHPTRGLFIVDTGVEHRIKDDPEHAVVNGLMAKLAKVESIHVNIDLKSWLGQQPQPLAGVFLTHLHLDHIMGMPDVPRGTPVFSGPGPEKRFAGLVDVFGDATLWALHVPGHTPGSTAYLARTPKGPVLMVGDACHTAWGWDHGVEPGNFSKDQPLSAASLATLQSLVKRHPNIDVRLGHQPRGQQIVPSG